jgi:hypothetical protein
MSLKLSAASKKFKTIRGFSVFKIEFYFLRGMEKRLLWHLYLATLLQMSQRL